MALGAGQVLRHGHMGDLGCAFVGVVRTRNDTTPFKIEFRKECRSDSDHPHHPSKIQWFSSRAGSSPNGSLVGCRCAGVARPYRVLADAIYRRPADRMLSGQMRLHTAKYKKGQAKG